MGQINLYQYTVSPFSECLVSCLVNGSNVGE